ncbi:hypothetical protein FHG87_003577 [Trinorchestia longiramus]|nr:hypothetical protein FHG87_003577 [Trinorchestia longiramus]
MAVSNERDRMVASLKKECLAKAATSKELKDITNTRILTCNISVASEIPTAEDSSYFKVSEPAQVLPKIQEVEGGSSNVSKALDCTPGPQHVMNKTAGKPPANGRKKLGASEPHHNVELEEEQCELLTPVQDGEDAVQALLSHHRLAAYLASPDRPATPPSLPPVSEGPTKPLTVGQCGRELAEAALESVGTVTRLPNNAVAFVADDLHEKIRMASPASLCKC